MREDLPAIELALAHDLAATTPTSHTLRAGTPAALRPVQKAIAAADPAPGAAAPTASLPAVLPTAQSASSLPHPAASQSSPHVRPATQAGVAGRNNR
jgi:hypothetical protein